MMALYRHYKIGIRMTMQGWSVSELSAQGGWKSLSQLKRYTQIKGEHLAQKMRGENV